MGRALGPSAAPAAKRGAGVSAKRRVSVPHELDLGDESDSWALGRRAAAHYAAGDVPRTLAVVLVLWCLTRHADRDTWEASAGSGSNRVRVPALET